MGKIIPTNLHYDLPKYHNLVSASTLRVAKHQKNHVDCVEYYRLHLKNDLWIDSTINYWRFLVGVGIFFPGACVKFLLKTFYLK